MHHSNIMGIIDVIPVYHKHSTKNEIGLEELYIILEYVDNDLRRLFESSNYLTDEQVREIMYQILWGTKYIHSAEIIHRDFKPSNILINNDCTVKICDFGLARSIKYAKDWEKIIQEYKAEDEEIKEGDHHHHHHHHEGHELTKHSSNEDLNVKRDISLPLPLHIKKTSSNLRKASDDLNKLHQMLNEMDQRTRISRALKRTETEREEADRQLTPHVVTRYYRPPEVILQDKHYGKKVDIWSLGWIFWELLQMKQENVNSYYKRKSLFTGKSWAILSPAKKSRRHRKTASTVVGGFSSEKRSIKKLAGVTENDQMNKIIKVLGFPDGNDLSFLTESKVKAFNATYEHYTGKQLSLLFPDEDEEWISLIRKMLEFNPYFRYSVEDCLNHPYFEKIRNKKNEKECKVKPIIDKEAKLVHIIHNFKEDQKKKQE